MPMRVTGMYSGLDTETIIQELVAAKRTKVDDLKKAQTKLEWKQTAWKDLNTKIKKLYDSTLSNLRLQGSYSKKTTKISNSSIADIITSDSAMNTVQTLRVAKLAKSGYLTGGEVQKADGSKCTMGTKLTDMGIAAGSRIEIATGGKTTEIEVTDSMTINGLVTQLNNAGVNANFDSKTQRFFIGAKDTGVSADFTLTAANDAGTGALNQLGLLSYDKKTLAQYEEYAGLQAGSDAYKAVLDKEVARRLADYVKKGAAYEKNIEAYNKELEKIKKAYVDDGVGTEEDFDALVNNTDGRLDTMKTRQQELETKSAAEGLTDEETAELNSIKSSLSYVEEYQKTQESLDKTTADLAEVQKYYQGDDKEASDLLKTDVTSWLDTKIAKAQAVLADTGKKGSDGASRIIGQDAEIYLNDAKFESAHNTFEINGLTITCNAETGDEAVTLTTQNDTSGVYNMIKNFIKEYSSLINEMDKLYNADSAKDYEPLTDEEKDAMSETEVEKWEQKIKDSLLRRDSTLNTVSSAFKTIMAEGISVGGKTMYLSDFGIETLGYFEAEENEKNAYHIFGDEEDDAVKSKTNKLQSMISTDPDTVMDFFSQLTKKLYDKTTDLMKAVKGYSSSYTVYEDKKLKSDYDDYTKKIKEAEEKLKAYEDKWYQKFAAMETALAKMQSNSSAISSLLGGNS